MNIILITTDTVTTSNMIELYSDYKIKTDKSRFLYNKNIIDSHEYDIDKLVCTAKTCNKYKDKSAFVIFTCGELNNYKKYGEVCDYWYYIDSNENIQCIKARNDNDEYSPYIHIHPNNIIKSNDYSYIKLRCTGNIPAWESYDYIMKAYNDSLNGIKCQNVSFIRALIRDYPNDEMRYTLETIRSLYEHKPYALK